MTDIKSAKPRRVAVLLLLLPLLFTGCIHFQKEKEDPLKNWTPPVCYYKEWKYTYLTDVDEKILTTALSPEFLLLSNKQYTLGEDYQPKELVELTCPLYQRTEPIKLCARAADALYLMLEEMKADGVKDVMVTSAYRSFAYQKFLYANYLEKESAEITSHAYEALGIDYVKEVYLDKGLTKLSAEDAKRVVLSYSAYPGTSEHQTGLCVDLVVPDHILTRDFEDTDAFRWLAKNAYRFGFILRYPENKESITGYVYEPWHYRFVGREAATDIFAGKLTLEEYLLKAEQS